MTLGTFAQLWASATGSAGQEPFPYQERLATEPWPDLLKVPTGLGKTAGVVLAWLYKRLKADPETPRRLVYCLPMRTLVEQTAANTRTWLENAQAAASVDGEAALPGVPHVLMGGEANDDWLRYPERPAILIGTQDMLLSRALMRGYGVSRARWPLDFALLHNDAMWVFDEVQLMAAGLPTSAQLEAFRRHEEIGTMVGCRSLWMSATLERSWLATVDLAADGLAQHELRDDDRAHTIVARRLNAPKALAKADVQVPASVAKASGLRDYADALAAAVVSAHRAGSTTLVILNRVDRAQALHDALGKTHVPPLLLLHSRFRPAERRKLNNALSEAPGAEGRIVVATQAVEAGIDMTSATLFTELAPWASLVQRFGRLNRSGEEADARALWIDIATDDPKASALPLPYMAADLDAARARLGMLDDVAPSTLEPFAMANDASWQVLRRKDLYQLFDTDADLTGFDVDVSAYVRGADATDIRVFWRTIADIRDGPKNHEADGPHRDEICAVPIGQARAWLTKDKKHRASVWDWISGRWERLDQLQPGALVRVDANVGGYDPTRGFTPGSTDPVAPVEIRDEGRGREDDPESFDGDRIAGRRVLLPDHLRRVKNRAQTLCEALGRDCPGLHLTDTEAAAVVTAALWHDVGKAHEVFMTRCGLTPDDAPLAKAPDYDWRSKDRRNRRHFRHELASALAWLAHGPADEAHDLIAYLIAAHHGKVRMGLRAMPDERGPRDRPDACFARGVWGGDSLPEISMDELVVPPTRLCLDVMMIGGGKAGRSWAARTQALLNQYGPFRLAFLEALVRIADWRASREEEKPADDHGGGDG